MHLRRPRTKAPLIAPLQHEKAEKHRAHGCEPHEEIGAPTPVEESLIKQVLDRESKPTADEGSAYDLVHLGHGVGLRRVYRLVERPSEIIF